MLCKTQLFVKYNLAGLKSDLNVNVVLEFSVEGLLSSSVATVLRLKFQNWYFLFKY